MKYFNYSTFLFFIVGILSILTGCIPHYNPYHPSLPKPSSDPSLLSFLPDYSITEEERNKNRQIHEQLRQLPFNMKDMNKEQLRTAIACYVELDDLNTAITYLERLLLQVSDENALKPLRLQLADLYFETGNFDKAGKHYALFLAFYPGSDEREYVQYKEILCRFYEVLAASKDQSKTKQTLALAEVYLTQKAVFKKYRTDVALIKHECKKLLAQHEIDVFNTNIMVNNLKGAEKRLNYVKTNYEKYIIPADMLRLEITLAERTGENAEIIDQKQSQLDQLLLEAHPKDEAIILAHQQKKKSAVERF